MGKRGLFALVLSFVFMISFVSAVSVSNTSISSNERQVDIASADDIYSYEINFNYTGADPTITQAAFIGEDGNDATYGYRVKDGLLSVYGSRLDASGQGISGSGNLFNITYTGELVLNYAYFIQNDTAGIYAYYTASSEVVDNTTTGGSTVGFLSGGGWAGGGVGTAYVLESDTLSKGIEKKLSKGDSFKFGLGGSKTSYSVGVISVEGSSVVLGIKKGVSLSLAYGEKKAVDLNGDGAEDVILRAEKAENGVSLFITDNIVAEEKSVSSPSGGIKDVGGSSVPVKKEVTYSSPYMEKVTSAVQNTVSGFFEGLWKSIVELFKF